MPENFAPEGFNLGPQDTLVVQTTVTPAPPVVHVAPAAPPSVNMIPFVNDDMVIKNSSLKVLAGISLFVLSANRKKTLFLVHKEGKKICLQAYELIQGNILNKMHKAA